MGDVTCLVASFQFVFRVLLVFCCSVSADSFLLKDTCACYDIFSYIVPSWTSVSPVLMGTSSKYEISVECEKRRFMVMCREVAKCPAL